ncbi:MAG TPA: adenylate/guanylate cyclase domain-containing protein [Candidatus Limnocylindria bacterium]|nr:adenylate/guanylate cyclase domain-containing protein [Candidatus Limnocylindria bacterium]
MLDRLLSIGSHPDDPRELRQRRRFLVGFSLAIVLLDPLWSAVYYTFGETTAAVIPMLYPPLTLANLALFARTRSIDQMRAGQSLIILTLPFLLHVALGGFERSSAVLLWSFFAPLGGLVFGGAAAGARWLAAFAVALAIGAALPERATSGLPDRAVTAFFVANIATISAVAFGTIAFYSSLLAAERARSERLLLNVLPAPIAERLREREGVIADAYDAATILFADVVGSTPLTVELSPTQMVALLDEHVSAFDELARRHGVEKIRTIGDNWMGVAGVPRPRGDHAEAVARLALGMLAYVDERRAGGQRCLDFRIGVNSGPVIGGVIGRTKFVFDIWGDPVNTASRMESHGEAGRIQITESTYALVRDRFVCEPRGTVEIKGKGPTPTWWLVAERHADKDA